MKKKLILTIVVFFAISLSAYYFYQKDNTQTENGTTTAMNQKWVVYHNEKYGYSVSYPEKMKFVNSTDDGIGGRFFNDMPGQGFDVTATSTAYDLLGYISAMQEYRRANIKFITEKSYEISGLPAAMVHEEDDLERKPIINDYSSRTILVKKGNTIFQFSAEGGGEGDTMWNTAQFAKSISFDK